MKIFSKLSQALILLLSFLSQNSYAEEMQHTSDHSQIFHAFTVEADHGQARSAKENALNFSGWVGGDYNRLWLRGERKVVGKFDNKSEVQALYSRNVAQFWDLQAGLRYDTNSGFSKQSMSYLTIGVEGLATYFFETTAQAFLSERGNGSFRLEQSLDVLLTQKLITQPYYEAQIYAQDVLQQQVASGLSEVEVGLKTRYEFSRKFAPYFAVHYHAKTAGTKKLAARNGAPTDDFIVGMGLRIRF